MPDVDRSGRRTFLRSATVNGTGLLVASRVPAAGADEGKAKAMFETTAEVLTGLITAYDRYEQRAEQSAGRFEKIAAIPFPHSFGPFVGWVEIVCGSLILVDLLTLRELRFTRPRQHAPLAEPATAPRDLPDQPVDRLLLKRFSGTRGRLMTTDVFGRSHADDRGMMFFTRVDGAYRTQASQSTPPREPRNSPWVATTPIVFACSSQHFPRGNVASSTGITSRNPRGFFL